ncbi:hypothetical protein CW710_00175 [Candidatus Bathyarchaeota archaeon]|nr:MAG: hypothetical protein CW710_00175 [Candidatus Bathyarchaeota archaeon]
MLNRLLARLTRLAETFSSLVEEEDFRRFKEALLAFSTDLGGLVAGLIVASQLPMVLKASWTIMLYPLALSLRGNIGGVFSGRLSTGLHLGLIEPRFRGSTHYFKLIFLAMQFLTLILAFVSGLVVAVAQIVLEGAESFSYAIISTALATQALSIIVTMPLTCLLGFAAFERSLDPDVLVYPVMSTVSDIVTTLMYMLALKLFFISPSGPLILTSVAAMYSIAVLLLARRYFGDEEFLVSVREASVALLFSVSIGLLSGLALSEVRAKLAEYPSVVTVYPAVIDTLGDFGSSMGSIFTTRLAEGSTEARLNPSSLELFETVQIWLSCLVYYLVYGLIALTGGFKGTVVVLLCFLLSSPIILMVSRMLALETFRRGLNPDNFVIPLETTLSDSLTTIIMATLLMTL